MRKLRLGVSGNSPLVCSPLCSVGRIVQHRSCVVLTMVQRTPLNPLKLWHLEKQGGSPHSWKHREHSAASCCSYCPVHCIWKYPVPRTMLLHRPSPNSHHSTGSQIQFYWFHKQGNQAWEGWNDLHSCHRSWIRLSFETIWFQVLPSGSIAILFHSLFSFYLSFLLSSLC